MNRKLVAVAALAMIAAGVYGIGKRLVSVSTEVRCVEGDGRRPLIRCRHVGSRVPFAFLACVRFEVERRLERQRLLASPVGLFLMVGWLVLRRVKESRFVGRLTRRGWAWWL